MKLIGLCFAVLLAFSSQASAQDAQSISCKKEGASSSLEFYGVLTEVENTHPNGTQFKSYVLDLVQANNFPTAFCFVNSDNSESSEVTLVGSVQINPMNLDKTAQSKLAQSLGKKILVKGDFYIGHTAWHIREVVVTPLTVVF